jgi:hypothetical protein
MSHKLKTRRTELLNSFAIAGGGAIYGSSPLKRAVEAPGLALSTGAEQVPGLDQGQEPGSARGEKRGGRGMGQAAMKDRRLLT